MIHANKLFFPWNLECSEYTEALDILVASVVHLLPLVEMSVAVVLSGCGVYDGTEVSVVKLLENIFMRTLWYSGTQSLINVRILQTE